MKNYLTLLLLFSSYFAFGQNTWNQRLPFQGAYSFARQDVVVENERILVCNQEEIAAFDLRGTCTGRTSLPTGQYSNFVRCRFDPNSGEMIFLSGMRGITGNNSRYSLRLFKPGAGFLASLELPDSLGNPNQLGGATVALDDSTVVVFGRTFAYKVRVQGNSSFTQLWQQPLAFLTNSVCNAALAVNNGFVALSLDGSILGLDGNGLQQFSKTLPFSVSAAAAIPDGIIVSGSNSAQKAVLAKLTFEGDMVWLQAYGDKQYNHVAASLDGGLVATGTTADNLIVLLKTNGNGQQSWSKTYQKGGGTKVVPMPDGGYLLVASSMQPTGVYGIRTDGVGTTAPVREEFFVQNRQLNNEGLKASFEPTASLFFNGAEGTLISPANGEATSIFTFSLQIGGIDSEGLLHLAADDYSTGLNTDFHAGMVGGVDGDYKRVWLAKKSEIRALRRDFLTDQALNDEVPYDLLTWPAKGNQHNEYNIDFTKIKTDPMLQSAPFVDHNGDGKYNVFDGDYPLIKGDQMAWWMLNDDTLHLNSYASPVKADVAIWAYLYDCPQNESVKNSLFVDFQFVNRSGLQYDSCFLGFFTDFDLGCYLDDNIGSIPASNTFYAYNRTPLDANCGNFPNFGDQIPIQTVTFQDREMSRFIYFSDASGALHPEQSDPGLPIEYYNYLKGNWRDGTALTMGGSGYNPNSSDVISHAFPSNPADLQGWSLCTVSLPLFDNRRSLGSHGPFTLLPGESFNISVAFTTHFGIPLPCPDVFGLVKPAIEQLTGWSNDGALDAAPNLGVVQEFLGSPITLGTDIPGAKFQWSTGETSATIVVAGPGEYAVTVTSPVGCQSVESVLVKLGADTEAPLHKATWTLFPNPATDLIQINCPDCRQGEALMLVLRNAQGVDVHREQASGSSFQLQLHSLPAGMFWLELWEGGKYLGGKKFVHISR